MTSVNTNIAAITALRNLQQTQSLLEGTQNRISTGLKIGEAKDNAAYWSISTTLRSDNKSLATVKDALSLGSATVDTAYQGLNKAKDVLDEIKSKLTAASQDGVDRSKIQAEIAELQKQLKSIATSASFSGENWLSVNSDSPSFNASKSIVSSFSRDASGSVTLGSIGIDISDVKLFDTAGGGKGILDKAKALTDANGVALTVGGKDAAADPSVTALGFPAIASTGIAASPEKSAVATLGTLNLASVTPGDRLRFTLSVDNMGGTVNIKTDDLLAANGNLTTITQTIQTAVNTALGGTNKATVAIDATTKAVTITSASTGVNSSVAVGVTQTLNGDGSVTAMGGLLTAASLPAPASGTGTKASGTLGTFTAPSTALSKAEQTLTGTYTMTATQASQVLTGIKDSTTANAGDKFTFKLALNGGNPQTVEVTLQGQTYTSSQLKDAINTRLTAMGLNTSVVATSTASSAANANDGTITFTSVDSGAGQKVVVSDIGGTVASTGATVGTATAGTGGLNVGDTVAFKVTYGTTTKSISYTIVSDDMTGGNGLAAWATKNKPTAAELQALLQKKIDDVFAGTTFNDVAGGTPYTQGDIVLANDLSKISTKNNVGAAENLALKDLTLTRSGRTTPANGVAGLAANANAATGTGYRIRIGDSVSFKVQYGSDTKTIAHTFSAADFSTTLVNGKPGIASGWATPGQPTATEWKASLQRLVDDAFFGTQYSGKANTGSVNYTYQEGDITMTVGANGANSIGVETKKTGKDMTVGIYGIVNKIAGAGTAAQNTFGLAAQTTGTSTTGIVAQGAQTAAAFTIGTFDNANITGADTISFRLNVNGVQQDVSITTDGFLGANNVGYDRSRFQTKMQAALDTAFAASPDSQVTFNIDQNNVMTLTTKKEGENALIAISAVQASDGDSATTSKAGLENITLNTPVAQGLAAVAGTKASLTSGGTFTGPQTLGDTDKISFSVTVDNTTTRIDIDKARVNAALNRTDGKITDAAAYATVLTSAFNASAVGNGVLNATATGNTLNIAKVAAGGSLSVSGVTSSSGVADTVSIDTIDISDKKLRDLGVNSSNQSKVFAAYISVVNDAINNVTTAASNLGSLAKRIDLQQTFVSTMMDTIDKGVGKLVDADLSEESTRLQALQTKQQLGVQTLSIANQSAQSILALFRG